MPTLFWCWVALSASAFCWNYQQFFTSLLFSIPAGIILGFKLGQLNRVNNRSDFKTLLIGFLIVVTAGYFGFLTASWISRP
ncbi:MAG: hypothetical protein Q8P76_00020 [bacterium]|nr:hypothetical protein [bacterium]